MNLFADGTGNWSPGLATEALLGPVLVCLGLLLVALVGLLFTVVLAIPVSGKHR